MYVPSQEKKSREIIHNLSQKYFGVNDIFADVQISERDLQTLRYALSIHEPPVQMMLNEYAEFSKNRRGNLDSILKILFRHDIYRVEDLGNAIESKSLDSFYGIGRENKQIIREAYYDWLRDYLMDGGQSASW